MGDSFEPSYLTSRNKVFTTAAYDSHKNIVLLAFEIIEKIVRDYFPYITETETTAFTDCVNCLIAFTNSRSNKEISLSAIGFLRLCATKLAEGDIGFSRNKEKEGSEISRSPHRGKDRIYENGELANKEDHLYFWFPLLTGLSELSFDPRQEIRKNALQVLFDTLRNHGHNFSLSLWEGVFESVLFPIFDHVRQAIDPSGGDRSSKHGVDGDEDLDQDSWLYETCTLSLQLMVDIFVNFYGTVNPLLGKVLKLLVDFIERPHQSLAGIGVAALVRLMSNAGGLFSEDKWLEVVLSIKGAANTTFPDFSFVVCKDGGFMNREDVSTPRSNAESGVQLEDSDKQQSGGYLYAAIADIKCRTAVQLLLIQAITEIHSIYRLQLSVKNTIILFDAVLGVANHAHEINTNATLRSRLQELGPMTQMQDPPLLRLETESYQICLTLLQNLSEDRPPFDEESQVESYLIDLCHEVLKSYVEIARPPHMTQLPTNGRPHWLIPLGSGKKRELAARGPLIVATLQAICSLGDPSFVKNLARFLPLLSSLIRCEHGSNEVQVALSTMLSSSVGPVLLQLC
ncbi:hypothetical protein OSB04_011128 [Centaurea solstitialis]|uniref:Uncharacterized protein n=1 Tax=Centaurea solstitialis TaxID=347529 RepID=A0AA38T8V2_9ASTR|nr:hypothetical protein OSB04_011128 [Centaurea solstitialis]